MNGGLTANGLDVKANGTADPFADKPSAALRARVTRADLEPCAAWAAARAPCR